MNSLPKAVFWVCLIVFFIIVLAPLLLMFFDVSIAEGNFLKTILPDGRQLTLFKNSLIIGSGTVLFCLGIGLTLAFLIAKTDLPVRRWLFLFSIIPILIPSYITTIGWIKLLGAGGINLPFKIYGVGGVIFVLTMSYFPFITLLTLAGLFSINPKLEESAALVSPYGKVFRGITLPLIFPYVFSGAIFTFIFSVSNYGVPDLLRVTAYPVEIFTQFSAFYDPSKAVLLSLPLIGVTVILVLLQRHFMGSKAYVTLNAGAKEIFRVRLGRFKIPLIIFSCLVIILSVIVPILMLVIGAGPFITYVAAFKTAHAQIFNSVVLACISATLIIILSFPIAYFIQRAQKRVSLITDIISIVPFAIPPAILGIGLIKLWNWPATGIIYKTFLVVIFGCVGRFIAFAIRIISSNISQIHPNLEESAVISCKSWWTRLVRIMFPLTKQGFLYAWIICFALSIGELETTLLVTPAGESTLPIRIYTLMHYGAHKLVFGLCFILLLIIFLPIGAVLLSNRPLKRQTV